MNDKLVYSDIFKTAWKGLKTQFWLLVGLIIGFTIVSSLLIIFATPAKGESVEISDVVVLILGFLLFCLFLMGYLKNCVQTLEEEEPQFSSYGQVSRILLSFIVMYLLFEVIVLIGTALLIIPGVYLFLRLQFCFMSMVDENTGIIESLKRSWSITKGYSLQLFILALIMILIFFIGCVALFAGIFIAIPLMILMYVYSYRKLTAPSAE
jgi:Membrane domain of glycerophosphoryl diester phosphodiesterase.